MVVLRNRKNTQEHQVAFAEAKTKAQAQAKAEAEAKLQAEAEAKTDKIQEWLATCAKIQEMWDASAKAKARAKAEAEARVKAEEEARAKADSQANLNARLLEKLNRATYKMWSHWEHDTGATPTFADCAYLVEQYAALGFPVPKCLIEALCELVQDLPTTVYPEPEVAKPQEQSAPCGPCACEIDDKWADDKWYDTHILSGSCHAYKPWI